LDESEAVRAFENAIQTQRPVFGEFFLAKFLGFELVYDDARSVLTFNVADFMFNPQGSLHGGIIALALDVSMGHFIHHKVGAGGTTLEMKIRYLRPVLPGLARCEGSFLRQGRRLSFMEARMWNQEQKLAAVATSTWQMPAGP
jgi:acyl-CoA thioesterase